MKRRLPMCLLVTGVLCLASRVQAETEQIDLKALAKKARPAVMLLVVSDANGKEIATGTGFLVSSDGKLITNHHVIEGAASAVAKPENGGLFPVEGILADDAKNDLVLLKLKGKDLPFLTLSTNSTVEVGTRIAVIGSPLGLEGTLSEGIVSAVRDLMGEMRVLQITAAVSPGSSGSPVLDAKGQVIGVAKALLREGQALNFAVSVEDVRQVLVAGASIKTTKKLSELAREAGDSLEADPDEKALLAAHLARDYVEALKLAKVLVTRFPDNARAWNELGGTYYMLDFYGDAVDAFRQSIKCKPDYAASWQGLGVALMVLHKDAECIDACRQALRFEPDKPATWDILGTAYSNLGQFAEAVAAFRQAVRLKPDYADAWRDLGVACGEEGRQDEARDAFRRAKQLRPGISK